MGCRFARQSHESAMARGDRDESLTQQAQGKHIQSLQCSSNDTPSTAEFNLDYKRSAESRRNREQLDQPL